MKEVFFMQGVYIHIPFCKAICTYCDFAKELAKPEKKASYIDALIKEITTKTLLYKDVKTLYIGGGTPSSLEFDLLEHLFKALKSTFNLSDITEFTIECNPNDITKEKAALFKQYGVNRISLGVQTFNESHLKFLNRKHTNEDVKQSIEIFRSVGIHNISIDLIFSLVNQTLEEIQEDLTCFLKYDLPHLSFYSLIFEEDTKLYHLYEQGKVMMNDDSLEATMYATIIDTLVKANYTHYEISNFAKDNFESEHNKIYWHNDDYIGLGAGAHGKIHGYRYANIRSAQKYIDAMNLHQNAEEYRYPYEPERDYLLMGFRLLEGINLETFKHRFNHDLLETYPALKEKINQKLLIIENGTLKFTRKGLFLGNEIFSLF